MVNPFVIAAAASAGVGAAVAFEFGVFRPWREETWPHGFREGIKVEFEKLRREFEEGVHEIRDDIRDGIRGRRSPHRRPDRDRLSDEELDEFRRSSGPSADQHEHADRGLLGSSRSSSSETIRSEFEMHERQASAYRTHLAVSMGYGRSTGLDNHKDDLTVLRRRNAPHQLQNDSNYGFAPSPAPDKRRPGSVAADPFASLEAPHHALGDASPSMTDSALPADHLDADSGRLDCNRGGKTSLSAASPRTAVLAALAGSSRPRSDPFGDPDGLNDAVASSWQAVFERDVQKCSVGSSADVVPPPANALVGENAWKDVARSNASSDSFVEASPPSPVLSHSLVDVTELAGPARAPSSDDGDFIVMSTSETHIDDADSEDDQRSDGQTPDSVVSHQGSEGDGSSLEFRSLSLYLDTQQSISPVSHSRSDTSAIVSDAGNSDELRDGDNWLPLETSSLDSFGRRRLAESDEESWAELGQSDSD